MKITKSQLRQIIKEELQNVLAENMDPVKLAKLLCSIRPLISTAMENPKFGRPILEAVLKKQGGEVGQSAVELIKTLEKMSGVSVEDMAKDPAVKKAAGQALQIACMFI